MGLHEGVKVKDESLEILRAFLEFPNLLIATGLIVKYADDDVLIDRFAAAGCIL
jgi:hypothetical protein